MQKETKKFEPSNASSYTQPVAEQQTPQQAIRDDLEAEDDEESYYRYMEENPNAGLLPVEEDGIEIGILKWSFYILWMLTLY